MAAVDDVLSGPPSLTPQSGRNKMAPRAVAANTTSRGAAAFPAAQMPRAEGNPALLPEGRWGRAYPASGHGT